MKPLTAANAAAIARALDAIAEPDITDTIACLADEIAGELIRHGVTAYELQDDAKGLGE